MSEYIVSARKYRPLTFDSVVGQKSLTTTLKNAIKSGRLAHAFLFCGPRGVGKTTCARIFAKTINCSNPTAEGEACDQCESCQAFNEGRSYNVFELDAASHSGVEDIKDLMEQTRIPPQVGKYKVFVIDEVHMLSGSAFNAFLKTLEEPPANVIFILATTEKHKILPTILSRCQIYDFERMTVENTIQHLKMVAEKEGIAYEEEALAVIAEKADGGMRDALSIFDQVASFSQGNITYEKVIEDLNVLDADNYFNIVDKALENKVTDIMVLLNGILERGFDGSRVISGLASHIRNVMLARDTATLPMLEVSDRMRTRYADQAKRCPQTFLYKSLEILNRCDLSYRQSSNKRLLVELTLIQVAQLTQPDDADAAGRSPKRLKSLFKRILSNTQPKVAAAQVAAAGEKVVPVTVASPARRQTVSQPVPAVATENDSNISSRPRKRREDLMLNFNNLLNPKKQIVVEEEHVEDVSAVEDKSFDDEQLLRTWIAMCNRMVGIQQFKGLAMRMKNLVPHITTMPDVEVVVDNEMLLGQLTAIRRRIQSTLVKELNNKNVTFNLRLSKQEEVERRKTVYEVYEELKTENQPLRHLVESLNLQLV